MRQKVKTHEALRARLRITRAGICARGTAATYLVGATMFAPWAWGFDDGSVLIYRARALPPLNVRQRMDAVDLSRMLWSAYDLG